MHAPSTAYPVTGHAAQGLYKHSNLLHALEVHAFIATESCGNMQAHIQYIPIYTLGHQHNALAVNNMFTKCLRTPVS